ncbi:hypothetical protein [Mycobacterium avium]|uniref:hypothetical protein n=1 Tax=Mycobacterium avium TaxID=1764 RepID=UPI000CE2CF2C|nr:hypothetical protein [Mycobacterium avium]
MRLPIYPTVHLKVDDEHPEAFETNTFRLTLQTYIPKGLVGDVDDTNIVVGELLGKAKELIRGDRKELTSGPDG